MSDLGNPTAFNKSLLLKQFIKILFTELFINFCLLWEHPEVSSFEATLRKSAKIFSFKI